MSAKVTVDGVPNEAASWRQFTEAIAPLLTLLGELDAKDVLSLSVNPREVRAKVVMRTKRGRVVHGSWAHVSRRVDFPLDNDEA